MFRNMCEEKDYIAQYLFNICVIKIQCSGNNIIYGAFFYHRHCRYTQINGLDPVISHSKNLPITEDGIINRENKSIIINNG